MARVPLTRVIVTVLVGPAMGRAPTARVVAGMMGVRLAMEAATVAARTGSAVLERGSAVRAVLEATTATGAASTARPGPARADMASRLRAVRVVPVASVGMASGLRVVLVVSVGMASRLRVVSTVPVVSVGMASRLRVVSTVPVVNVGMASGLRVVIVVPVVSVGMAEDVTRLEATGAREARTAPGVTGVTAIVTIRREVRGVGTTTLRAVSADSRHGACGRGTTIPSCPNRSRRRTSTGRLATSSRRSAKRTPKRSRGT
ncbi:hypothetical protein [Humibacter antri]